MRLYRSGLIVAFYTLVSRIFGLFRELFVAYTFGADTVADSVNVAFKLPNLFRRIFGEGALATVFVPLFNQKLLESNKKAEYFSGEVFTYLVVILIALILLMQFFMPSLMFIIAPGFHNNHEKFNLTILLCRITMPYLIFISLAAFLGSILNSVNRFAAFSFVPVILNIAIVAGTILLNNFVSNAIAISASILIGGLLQLGFMWVALKKAKIKIPLVFSRPNDDAKRFLANMFPAILSSGVIQLNLFISQSIASFIPGAISILSYADRIYQFPLSIIGVTFSTILLPELSKANKNSNLNNAHQIQNNAIKLALLLSLPATCGIIALSEPIIHIIYERGHFLHADTIKTASTMAAFTLGLPAFILIKILSTIYYSNNDFKTPLKIISYSLVMNSLLNFILIVPFNHIGIALSSSISSWCGLWLLYRRITDNKYLILDRSLVNFTIKLLVSCGIMLLALIVFYRYNFMLFYHHSLIVKLSVLSAIIGISSIIFFAIAYYSGALKELQLKKSI